MGGMTSSLSVGVPAWKDMNGRQSEPDYRILFGVGAGF